MRCHGATFDRVTLQQGVLEWKMGTWHIWGMAEGVIQIQKKSSVRTAKGTYTASGPQNEAYEEVVIREIDNNHATLSTQMVPAPNTVIGFCTSEMMNFKYGAGEKNLGLWLLQQLPPSPGGIKTSKQITCLGPVSVFANLRSPILPNGAQVILQTKSPIYFFGYSGEGETNRNISIVDTNWPDEFYLAQPKTRPDVGVSDAFESASQAFTDTDQNSTLESSPALLDTAMQIERAESPPIPPPNEFAYMIANIAPKGVEILDFGLGDNGVTAFYLHKLGIPVAVSAMDPRHPLHDPTALERTYSLIYAKNVLEKIGSPQDLMIVVYALSKSLTDMGIFIADYPRTKSRSPHLPGLLQALERGVGGVVNVYPLQGSNSHIITLKKIPKQERGFEAPARARGQIAAPPPMLGLPPPSQGATLPPNRDTNPSRDENPAGEDKPRSRLPFMTKVDIRQRLNTSGARTRQTETQRTISMMKRIPFDAVLSILAAPETYSRTDLMSLYRYVLGGCIGTPNEIRKGAYPRQRIYDMISSTLGINSSPDVADVFIGDDGARNWREASSVWGNTVRRLKALGRY
jgi:hypothetical protein